MLGIATRGVKFKKKEYKSVEKDKNQFCAPHKFENDSIFGKIIVYKYHIQFV